VAVVEDPIARRGAHHAAHRGPARPRLRAHRRAIAAGELTIPARPGPTPACSDAELLTIALVRHLLGRRSEAGFVAEVARDWARLLPRLPHQSQVNRRIRLLWAAFEQLRAALAAGCPVDDCVQIDTSALPVKPPVPSP
jgi:hypothetical protein